MCAAPPPYPLKRAHRVADRSPTDRLDQCEHAVAEQVADGRASAEVRPPDVSPPQIGGGGHSLVRAPTSPPGPTKTRTHPGAPGDSGLRRIEWNRPSERSKADAWRGSDGQRRGRHQCLSRDGRRTTGAGRRWSGAARQSSDCGERRETSASGQRRPSAKRQPSAKAARAAAVSPRPAAPSARRAQMARGGRRKYNTRRPGSQVSGQACNARVMRARQPGRKHVVRERPDPSLEGACYPDRR